MPVVGSGRIQAVGGVLTFPAASTSSNLGLTGFNLQTPSAGTNLFDSISQTRGNVTLLLRSITAGPGIQINVVNGVLTLSVLASWLPPGPSCPHVLTYYDIVGYWSGQLPDDTDPIHYLELVRSISLPEALTGSIASCATPPTSPVTLNLSKNGIIVGTMNFAASATIGTFTFPSPVTFVSGDVWQVSPPNPQDETFGGLSWTIIASVL